MFFLVSRARAEHPGRLCSCVAPMAYHGGGDGGGGVHRGGGGVDRGSETMRMGYARLIMSRRKAVARCSLEIWRDWYGGKNTPRETQINTKREKEGERGINEGGKEGGMNEGGMKGGMNEGGKEGGMNEGGKKGGINEGRKEGRMKE